MPISRLAHYRADDPYTRIPNTAVRDQRLDLKARGLLLVMLSKPDGWRFTERNLASECGVSRDQIRTAIERLVETGYVVRERIVVDGRPVLETRVFDVANGEGRVSIPESVGVPDGRESRPLSKTKTSKTEVTPARRSSRERDLLFEAMVDATGQDAKRLTASERGRINKALKDLRAVDATPDQIRKAATRWATTYPGARITATAIAANWTTICPPAEIARCLICGQPTDRHDDDVCAARGGNR
jgi:DNA-binding Lrp family transcriptional regulator